MPAASTMMIEELSADGQSVNRSVTLQGSTLPVAGAKWGFENRLKTTWYPGNQDEATQQTMGRQEAPSAWSGTWSSTMMARDGGAQLSDAASGSQGVVDPFALWSFLELILSSGRRLRVTWSLDQQASASSANATTVAWKIVRTGRCKRFVPSFGYAQIVDWEIEFEWASRGKSTARVAQTRDASIGNNSAAYASALAAVQAANQLNFNTVGPSYLSLGLLEQLSGAPLGAAESASIAAGQLQNDLQAIVGLGSNLAQQPYQVTKSAVATGRDAQATASGTYFSLSGQAPETFSTQTDATSVLAAWSNFAQMQDACRLAWGAAWLFTRQVQQTIPIHAPVLQGELGPQNSADSSTILAVHVCKQGEILPAISLRYYSSPDHADDIARANNLAWHTYLIPPGTILVIPRISTTSQTT
jgi:hypothetical protein